MAVERAFLDAIFSHFYRLLQLDLFRKKCYFSGFLHWTRLGSKISPAQTGCAAHALRSLSVLPRVDPLLVLDLHVRTTVPVTMVTGTQQCA